MSINDRLKKTIEDLKNKLEYSTNEYNKSVANYGEQNIQAIYSNGEKTALEYAINQLEEIVYDRNKWQLEDLEEELGCPLEVVVKAVKDGIYYEDVANRMKYMVVDLHCNLLEDFVLYFSDEEALLTRNYKKTWWLKKDKSE